VVVLEIRLLGPVEIRAGGRLVEVGAPQRRLLLAALAVDAGRPVPVDTLIDRVWGQDAPRTVRAAVHSRITYLRAVLAEAAAAAPPSGTDDGGRGLAGGAAGELVLGPGGYVLRVDPDGVDVLRFRRLAAEARRPERSDPERVGLLDEALGLWRGVPLAGLGGAWAAAERDSWSLHRLAAGLDWSQAALRLGQHADVIPVARELAEAYPLDEALAVVLARALAADGRRAEAAALCAEVSHRLRREADVDPGPQLRALHQAILANESLPPLPPAPASAASAVPVPAQLPGDVPGFAGRAEHLSRLDTLLATAPAAAPTAVVITAVSGTAGVGKSTLAVHWAHRVAARFPDGQLYVNLRGFDPAGRIVDPAAAIRGFLTALGVPAERIPADPDAQAALYRSLLSSRRVLVLVDNARDADHARPLLPGSPTALAVVTSRNSLTGLVAADGAHPLALDLLSTVEARELLARRLGPGRVAAEPEAAEAIITASARLPLALALVAARAAAHPAFPLAALAAELSAAGERAGWLDAGDVLGKVRAVFSWSDTALTRDAARLFRLLGLHPGPDVSAAAAASLAAAPPAQTRRLLAELTRAGLLSERAPGRYGFHDLLAAYAADLTHSTDTDAERRAATTRLLDHYTHTAHAADRLLNPARDPIPLPLAAPAAGATPEQLASERAALGWLSAEHPVLLAAVRLAAGAGFDAHAWQLAWALSTFLIRRGHWHDQAGAAQAAVAAADRLAHPAAGAYARRELAAADTVLGRYDQAHAHLRRALDLHAEAGDPTDQAYTHLALAILWERQERPDQSLEHAEQALALYQAAGHRRGEADALNAAGWFQARLGNHTQALACGEQALTLHQQAGDRWGEASTWDNLGYAHHHLAHLAEATDCYQHALALYRDLGDRYYEANSLIHLGDTHHAAGLPDAARTAWTGALDVLTDLDHPDADTLRTKLASLDEP
jgi:DNA-binding SARP family transcriptional activator/tetratricopeptide (TPR) repeat protein